jgi:hypothetical protein
MVYMERTEIWTAADGITKSCHESNCIAGPSVRQSTETKISIFHANHEKSGHVYTFTEGALDNYEVVTTAAGR